MSAFQLRHHQLMAGVKELAVGQIAGDDRRQTGGREQHKRHHNLIFNGLHRINAGKISPDIMPGKLTSPTVLAESIVGISDARILSRINPATAIFGVAPS